MSLRVFILVSTNWKILNGSCVLFQGIWVIVDNDDTEKVHSSNTVYPPKWYLQKERGAEIILSVKWDLFHWIRFPGMRRKVKQPHPILNTTNLNCFLIPESYWSRFWSAVMIMIFLGRGLFQWWAKSGPMEKSVNFSFIIENSCKFFSKISVEIMCST